MSAVSAAADDIGPDPGQAEAGATIVSRRTAGVLLVLVVVLWGVHWPIMKVGLEYIAPLSYTAVRVVLAFVAVVILVGVAGQLRRPDRRDLPIILSTGLIQVAVVSVLVNVALLFVPAGRAAILLYTTPLWVTPMAAVVLHEHLTPIRAAGLVIGMAGVAVLFNPAGFDWTDPDVVLGNSLLLLAAFAWAVQIVFVRSHTWRSTPLQLLPWQLGVACCLVVPLALAFEAGQPIDLSGPLPAILLYTGLVATAFCNWAVISVNRALPATTTSLLILGVPVCGVLFSALAFGESLTATTLAGLTLIIAGLAAVAVGERQPAAGV